MSRARCKTCGTQERTVIEILWTYAGTRRIAQTGRGYVYLHPDTDRCTACISNNFVTIDGRMYLLPNDSDFELHPKLRRQLAEQNTQKK